MSFDDGFQLHKENTWHVVVSVILLMDKIPNNHQRWCLSHYLQGIFTSQVVYFFPQFRWLKLLGFSYGGYINTHSFNGGPGIPGIFCFSYLPWSDQQMIPAFPCGCRVFQWGVDEELLLAHAAETNLFVFWRMVTTPHLGYMIIWLPPHFF